MPVALAASAPVSTQHQPDADCRLLRPTSRRAPDERAQSDKRDQAVCRGWGGQNIKLCAPEWVPLQLLAVADKQMANPIPGSTMSTPELRRIGYSPTLPVAQGTVHQFIRESGCARLAAQALSRSARLPDHLLVKRSKPNPSRPGAGCPLLALQGKQIASIWLADPRHGRGQFNGGHPGLAS